MMLQTVVYQHPLAPFIRPKEQDRARKRAAQGWDPSAIQASPEAFLPPYRVVRLADGCVLGGHVGITLLPRLDRIE